MLPAAIADPVPGEHVLDLCAAPGGKSTQIAGRLRGEGLLVSNEIHPARARVLSANMERMGVRNAVVTGEDPARLSPRFPGHFDLVMVDAPCSGEGMFRKEPQASADWSPETVAMCAERQRGILEEAAVMTAPGGRIVYSTCTFARQENEETVLHFLKKHPDFRLETPELLRRGCPGLSEGLPSGDAEERALCRRMVRIWPHRTEGEGHFAALLVRDGERKERGNAAGQGAPGRGNRRRTAGRGGDTARKQEALQLWEEFARSALSQDCALLTACRQYPDHLILFGEELYLLPAGMRLDGLRVLRPGLHLGTVRRGRFVPAHALAMALRPEEAAGILRIVPDSAASAAWLRGESMSAEGPFRGWILVCAGDCSLGWGRSDGRIVKNHYPKGLRV